MCTRIPQALSREERVRRQSLQSGRTRPYHQAGLKLVVLCALVLGALPVQAGGLPGGAVPSVHDLEITQGGRVIRPGGPTTQPSVHDLEVVPSVHDLEVTPSVHDLEEVPSVHDLEDVPSVHDLEDAPSVHDLEDEAVSKTVEPEPASVHDLEDTDSVHDLE